MIYDRKRREILEEKQYKGKQLELLYQTSPGRLLLRAVCVNRWFSSLAALYYDSRLSSRSICSFIAEHGIVMTDFEQRRYRSFNDFFTRRLRVGARPIDMTQGVLIAPCDAKLTAYEIDGELCLNIKNSVFGVDELLRDERLAKGYIGGTCLVFRLTADDCHRYVFFDDGYVASKKKIKGVLHTVRPIAFARHKVYCENSREYSVIQTDSFGKAVFVEVGAMLIGRMNNREVHSFFRGDEKGYFEYGGSTIIVLLEKGAAKLDSDIAENSKKGVETKVQLGERIGEKC